MEDITNSLGTFILALCLSCTCGLLLWYMYLRK